MFVEVNEQYINAVYVSSLKKDTSDGYKLNYNLASGGSLVEEFASESDLNDKYDSVKSAMSGGGSAGMKYKVVQTLPQTGEEGTIYLVPKQSSKQKNVYDEFMWIDNDWEKIGDTEIDLSGYQTLIDVNNMLNADYVDDSSSTHKFVSEQEKAMFLTNISELYDFTFILDGLKKGIYILKISGTPWGLKLKESSTRYIMNNYMPLFMLVPNDISDYKIGDTIAYIYSYAIHSGQEGRVYVCTVKVYNNDALLVNDSILDLIYDPKYLINRTQTIDGVKTFSSLPVSTPVPTADGQLTNKKYVDDAIAAAAGGGSSVIDVNGTDYPQSNPLILNDLAPGTTLYCSDHNNCGYVGHRRPSDDVVVTGSYGFTSSSEPYPSILMKFTKFGAGNTGWYFLIGLNGYNSSSISSADLEMYYSVISVSDNSLSFNRKAVTLPDGDFVQRKGASITGKFTFNSVLPESSLVPSTDNQLVNKKYVDDAIAAITDATNISY